MAFLVEKICQFCANLAKKKALSLNNKDFYKFMFNSIH